MIKKASLLILSNLLLVLFISGCGKKNEKDTSPNTTTNTQTKQDKPPSDKVSQSEETVKNWINALGNRNFKEAHGLMTSKKGGAYSKFSSTNGYGGINKTNILSSNVEKENEFNAEVVAEYESFDPVNRDGKFKQRFILVKEGNKWLISDIKKIDIAFYNEKSVTNTETKKESNKYTDKGIKENNFSFIGSWTSSDDFGRPITMTIGQKRYYFNYSTGGYSSSGYYKQIADELNLYNEELAGLMGEEYANVGEVTFVDINHIRVYFINGGPRCTLIRK